MGTNDRLEEMPLFPLDTVLFPYASLYLHIFEARYREMIKFCLDEDRPFGIVLIRAEEDSEAEPYLVGTAVRIAGAHTYDDGRIDIHVQGERRFRIRRFDDSRPYLVGWVEPVVEMEIEDESDTNDLLRRAKDEVEALIHRLFSHRQYDVQIVFPSDPVALSFAIANLLQIDNLQKQRLLEMTDTLERVSALLPLLESHLLEVRQPFQRVGSQELADWITPN